MARFKSTITDKGAEVLTAFLAAGKQLVLTSAAAGDGVAQVSPNTLTALVNPISVNTQIGEKTFVESNPSYMRIPVQVTNAGLESTVYVREVAVYALDENDAPFMFSYSWLDGADSDNILPPDPFAERDDLDEKGDTIHIHDVAVVVTNQQNSKIVVEVASGSNVTMAQMTAYAAPILHSHNASEIQESTGGTVELVQRRQDQDISQLQTGLSGKVDKVNGKGLSTCDYTAAEKEKLATLANYNDSALRTLIDQKVDKEAGKGLSSNDYTTTEKEKLASLSNYNDTAIKSDITQLQTDMGTAQQNISQLQNDTGTARNNITELQTELGTVQQGITQLEGEMGTAQGKITQLQTDVSGKVDKETGKGLSSNDYTAADKAKVDAAPSYAEYQLTLASGLTGELHGYRIGNLCRIVGVVTGIKTTATDICSDLPDDLILSSGSVPAVLNPSISIANSLGYTLSVYKRALNGDRVLQGSIGKGFASTDPVVNLPCYIDISYPASL